MLIWSIFQINYVNVMSLHQRIDDCNLCYILCLCILCLYYLCLYDKFMFTETSPPYAVWVIQSLNIQLSGHKTLKFCIAKKWFKIWLIIYYSEKYILLHQPMCITTRSNKRYEMILSSVYCDARATNALLVRLNNRC